MDYITIYIIYKRLSLPLKDNQNIKAKNKFILGFNII